MLCTGVNLMYTLQQYLSIYIHTLFSITIPHMLYTIYTIYTLILPTYYYIHTHSCIHVYTHPTTCLVIQP